MEHTAIDLVLTIGHVHLKVSNIAGIALDEASNHGVSGAI